MCEYEASHYLDVVLTGFAVVVMFDYVLRLWPVVRHTVIHRHCYLHYGIH